MKHAIRIAAAALFLFGTLASGQQFLGKVQGFVKDPSGAVVPGAKVQLFNTATGALNTVQTNANGHYIFGFVNLGNYEVSAQAPGFARTVQENVTMRASGDVTVNLTLKVGSTSQTVTVQGAPPAVQFNTSELSTVITKSELATLPNQMRNPFTMAMLIPAGSLSPGLGVSGGQSQYPWNVWETSGLTVGGTTASGAGAGTEFMIDGAPSKISQMGGFIPSSDAVQEVNVSQNGADAEQGFSDGGVITLVTKSGTNQWHGALTYENQNPYFEARTFKYGTPNTARKQVGNVSLGNPIIKNKLFVFDSYEQWKWSPASEGLQATVPTEAEVNGDFSNARNKDGSLDVIYDPTTTVVNTATNTATRTPFPGNIIPQSRIDPTAKLMMQYMNWGPNRTPDDLTGLNNFHAQETQTYNYWNFMNRTDWNVSDKLRVYGHYGQLYQFTNDSTDGRIAESNYYQGNQNDSRTITGAAIYTLSPNMVLDVSGTYTSIDQLFPQGITMPYSQWSSKFLGADWGSSYYQDAAALRFPSVNVGEWGQTYGLSLGWLQYGKSWNIEPKLVAQKGRNYMKMGLDFRQQHLDDGWPAIPSFNFSQADTAATYINPNLATSGNGYASFLLGGIDSGDAPYLPTMKPRDTYFALFFQDDLKLTPRIMLNLGLRADKDTGPTEAQNRIMQYANPNGSLPALASAGIVMPATVTQLDSEWGVPLPTWTGGAYYATSSNPHLYGTSVEWQPRVGFAFRINNETSLRAAYSHWAVPPILTLNGLQLPTGINGGSGGLTSYGYYQDTVFQGFIAGVPSVYLHNPVPNGLIPPTGSSLGVYTQLGGDLLWNDQKYRPPQSDRINVTLEHQFPAKLLIEGTYLFSYGSNILSNENYNYNNVNPQMQATLGSQLGVAVPNPFYNILTPAQFPGILRTYPTVALSQLVQPYPYYTSLQEMDLPGLHDIYNSVQLQVSRPLANGLQVFAAYAHDTDRIQQFVPNTMDLFNNTPQYSPSTTPHHRLNIAVVAQLPFGRGRQFANHLNRTADLLVGGWNFSAIYMFLSGDPLPIGDWQMTGIPWQVANPSAQEWFNPAAFELKTNAYALRTTPLYISGLNGPITWDLDCSFSKQADIWEKHNLKGELRFELYNATNTAFEPDPNMSLLPTDPQFGTIPATATPRNLSRVVQTQIKLLW